MDKIFERRAGMKGNKVDKGLGLPKSPDGQTAAWAYRTPWVAYPKQWMNCHN